MAHYTYAVTKAGYAGLHEDLYHGHCYHHQGLVCILVAF